MQDCTTVNSNADSNLLLQYDSDTIEAICNGFTRIDGYTMWRSATASQPQNTLYNYADDNTTPSISFRKARGGIISGSPDPVQSGDFLGKLSFGGYANSGWRQTATILAQAAAAPSGNFVKTKLYFQADSGSGVESLVTATVDEWKLRPERGDNHWFDCLVGCAVAASMQGTTLPGTDGVAPVKRKRVSFAELQRGRRR